MWNLAYWPGPIGFTESDWILEIRFAINLIHEERRFLLLDPRCHLSCWFAADKLLRNDEAAGFVADFR